MFNPEHVPIAAASLGGGEKSVVNAKDLHAML